MKVLVVGGGSGGHITPAVAVASEILKMHPRAEVEFWTDRKYYKDVVKITAGIGVRSEGKGSIRVRKISAGKFHRYAGWSFRDYFANFSITVKDLIFGNICGLFGFLGGFLQAFFRLFSKVKRPDVIFLKGGFVGLPVGLVAQIFKIPYVIHESDAVPGLANRMLMKQASAIAVGMEPSVSSPRSSRPSLRGSAAIARQQSAKCAETDGFIPTGTPVASEFHKISVQKQRALKRELGFEVERPLVVVTGGSQGSLHMDEAVKEVLPEMLKFTSVGLVAGKKHYNEMIDMKKYEEWDEGKLKSNFRIWSFNPAMHKLLGAADVVVSRAGATTIAELAALGKAVVLIPFEPLPGGHQVKNAERLKEAGAVEAILDEKMVNQPGLLLEAVKTLIRSPKKREKMAEKLHSTAKTGAARELAEIVIKVAKGKN